MDILHETKGVFNFLGLDFHEKVQEFLDTHTKTSDGSAFSTFRDINATADHWRVDLADNFSVVALIQNNCAEAMSLWGYGNVTEKDLILAKNLRDQ